MFGRQFYHHQNVQVDYAALGATVLVMYYAASTPRVKLQIWMDSSMRQLSGNPILQVTLKIEMYMHS